MLIIISDHAIKPGMMEKAHERLVRNGEPMSVHPGFVFRHLSVSDKRERHIVAFTAWATREAYDSWLAVRGGALNAAGQRPMSGDDYPYEGTESEVFEVSHSFVATPVGGLVNG